ncbi:MAG TPA: sensor domain-containing protein [Mycobacterium sp.]|nr:sensor domain-containing protein [Mycobacterium sp.]
MRGPRPAIAVAGACAVLAACTTTVNGTSARPLEARQPSLARALDQVLPTNTELSTTLKSGPEGYLGQVVEGGADMLLQGVGPAQATPVDCVSATYRLQKFVYQTSPVQSVASQSWAGGDVNGPSLSGFFGVVKLATADDADAFFAASADKWRRCDGQTMVLHQPGADGLSRITDVAVDGRIVSAVVMQGAGRPVTVQRALGVGANCIVDVEVSDVGGGKSGGDGAADAVAVAKLMLAKIAGAS